MLLISEPWDVAVKLLVSAAFSKGVAESVPKMTRVAVSKLYSLATWFFHGVVQHKAPHSGSELRKEKQRGREKERLLKTDATIFL